MVPSRAFSARPPRSAAAAGRDPRIDLLRGLALMVIFIDHIPGNGLSCFTLRAFGFSDAAEIFVFLAGYSSILAYPQVFARNGAVAGWLRIGRRCTTIWGAHALLLLGSLAILMLHQRLTGGSSPTALAPLLGDGLAGLLRGLTMRTLPAYLDILPLYIVLIAAFPLVMAGLRRSPAVTLAASLTIYGVAMVKGWNLPNQIDPRLAAPVWTFNPFTWQLVFVLGAFTAHGRQRGWRWLSAPPAPLKALCVGALVYGFVAADRWNLWPTLAEQLFPRAALDPEWKHAAAPWRVLHSLALLTLLLNSRRFAALAVSHPMQPLKACGRFSLPVFSAGCILALLGRLAFADLGPSPAVHMVVNTGGIALQLLLAWHLRRSRVARHAAPGGAAPQAPRSGPRGPGMRPVLAFGLGAALVVMPAAALLAQRAGPRPAAARHDYFPPPHLAADRRFRIVAFGSSSTHGHGASGPAATYPAQLQTLFDARPGTRGRVDVVNRGIDGEDVQGMLVRLDDDILPRRPDLIIWQLGSNDALHGFSPAEFGQDLRQGIARIAATGVPLVLIGPQWNPDPHRAALFARLNAVMRNAARDKALPMIDRLALTEQWRHADSIDPMSLLGPDGLHMNDRGYALLARAVFDVVAGRVAARDAAARASDF